MKPVHFNEKQCIFLWILISHNVFGSQIKMTQNDSSGSTKVSRSVTKQKYNVVVPMDLSTRSNFLWNNTHFFPIMVKVEYLLWGWRLLKLPWRQTCSGMTFISGVLSRLLSLTWLLEQNSTTPKDVSRLNTPNVSDCIKKWFPGGLCAMIYLGVCWYFKV